MSISNYSRNKERARTHPRGPSKTDQSAANDTDVNVIVKKYKTTGRVSGMGAQPLYGDFSELPTDLRGLLERTRDVAKFRNKLPEKLREMPIEELLMLQQDDIARILAPPDKPSDEPKKDETA